MDWKNVYSHELVSPSLYLIHELYYVSENCANIWFIQSDNGPLDILIDSGLGVHNIKQYLLDTNLLLPERKVVAIATHIHFDHSGGLHYFDDVAIHRDEADILVNGDQCGTLTWLSNEEIAVPPFDEWSARSYIVKPAHVTRKLEEGSILESGDIKLEVLHLPGHSRGSIALFESKKGWIFSGDVLYSGPLLDWLPESNLNDYQMSMQRLIDLTRKSVFTLVLPGHGPILQTDEALQIMQDYIQNSNRITHKISTSVVKVIAGVAIKIINWQRSKAVYKQ